MSISFTTDTQQAAAHPLSNDDIVGIVGVTTSANDNTNFVGNVGPIHHSTELLELVGSTKYYGSIVAGNTMALGLNAIMKQWGGEVVTVGLKPAATQTDANAALDLLAGYEDNPTMYVVLGDITNFGTNTAAFNTLDSTHYTTTKSDISGHLESICEDVYALGQTTSYHTSEAAIKAWIAANRGAKVLCGTNNVGNYDASAAALGAGLREVARFGRGTNINGARVTGLGGSLTYRWSPNNSHATQIANADGLVLVNDNGIIEVLTGDDGELATTLATDNEKYWEVARQVNYIKRALTSYSRQFLSRHMSQRNLLTALQVHADSLSRHGNANSIKLYALPSTGVHRMFRLVIDPFYAIRNMTYHTGVVDTLLTI